MSKSIYEQALEDLYYVIPVGYSKDMIGKTIQTKRLLDFIKQAQKQEQMLKLYQRLHKDFEDLSYEEVYDIKNKIKELEK